MQAVDPTTHTDTFLRALFANKPDDHFILIWGSGDRGKMSFFDRDIDRCIEMAGRLSEDANVYVGVGTSPSDYGEKRRCPSNDIAGIAGLWMDVDYQHPVHQKKRLPPSIDHAIALVSSDGEMAPTYIVHTGHGIQAWWLFKEFWTFESATERKEAAELAEGWQKTLLARATQRDWQMDSTYDLARVLRVPGSRNFKGKPVPVEIISFTGIYYNPSDFTPYLTDEAFKTRRIILTRQEIQGVHLTQDMEPPASKLMALLENDTTAKKTWNGKRTDLEDDSPSGYDMAMANIAAAAGWPRDEIIALLVARRRKHGVELHLNRPDKYLYTVNKAIRETETNESGTELSTLLTKIHEPDKGVEEAPHAVTDDERTQLMQALSDRLEVTINRISRINIDKGVCFEIETPRGTVAIEGIAGLIEQSAFRNVFAIASGRIIKSFKPEKWREVAQALLDAAESTTYGEETTTEGRAVTILTAYAQQRRIFPSPEEGVPSGAPFYDRGELWVHGPTLSAWARVNLGENLKSHDIGRLLAHLGGRQEVIHYKPTGANPTSRLCWSVPKWAVTGGWQKDVAG